MPTIFSKIIAGDIPCYKIAEDEMYFAFLDINPISEGHTLIVPKIEIDYLFDLENDVLSGMILFSKKIAKAIEKTVDCERIGMTVIGLEVPHAHIHLIPIKNESDMSFSKKRRKFSPNEMTEIAKKINANL